MNTLPPYDSELYKKRLEGAAYAYDGEQVDFNKSELPYAKYANEAIGLARSATEFTPDDLDEARNENYVVSPEAFVAPANHELTPATPQEFVLGLGGRLQTMRDKYDLAA